MFPSPGVYGHVFFVLQVKSVPKSKIGYNFENMPLTNPIFCEGKQIMVMSTPNALKFDSGQKMILYEQFSLFNPI